MSLPADLVTVWTFLAQPGEESDALTSGVSEEESDKAGRFHFAEDRQRYVFFHKTMRRLLVSVLPVPVSLEELCFTAGEHGKPTLCDFPEVHFNLSHSKDLGALAVSSAGSVGLDVEMLDFEFPVREIAREYFVRSERAAIDHAPDDFERTRRFFQIWTAKEAVMKVTGLGMNLEPRSIELALDPVSATPIGFHHVAGFPNASHDWKLQTQSIEPCAILSLVYPSNATAVHFHSPTESLR